MSIINKKRSLRVNFGTVISGAVSFRPGPGFRQVLFSTLTVLALMLGGLTSAWGSLTVQTYYVPVTEDQIIRWSTQLANGGFAIGNDVNNIISITATFNGTVIDYDQWEDGYEYDITNPTQSTTQIWGDGNAANGAPPGCAANGCDVINAGTVIALRNNPPPYIPNYTIPANPRDQSNQFFDGRDKFASSQQLVVTRAGWSVPQGAVLSGAAEVFDTRKWGTSYQLPIGTNSAVGTVGNMFTYTAVSIMAKDDGTVVQVDSNADGTAELTQTLNQGEVMFVENMFQGSTVTSSSAVQVDLMTGETGSAVAARWFSLIPKADWSSSYYSPVRTVSGVANSVILYNPGAAAITVNIATQAGAQTLTVPAGTNVIPAGGIARFDLPNAQSGTHFYSSGAPFYAILTADYNSVSNEWGALLIPELDLTPSIVIGWAPGSDNVPPTNNYSPVWVTTVGNTTLYIKYDGNTAAATVPPKAGCTPACGAGVTVNGNYYDASVALTTLQAQRIFDPDFNMTGARVWTENGTRIAAAWGQDSSVAPGGLPAMDIGTTVIPFPSLTAYKSSSLLGDYNNNGGLDAGELIQYTISVYNSGIVPITNILLDDTLDATITYVADTSEQSPDGITWTAISDNTTPSTRFPFDEGGYSLNPLTVMPGQVRYIRFQATVNNPYTGSGSVLNTARVSSLSASEIFTNNQTALVQQGKLTTTKTTISPVSQIIRAGNDIIYQITVTNSSLSPQTGIQLDELVPQGTTYKANSTSVTGPRQKYVKDVFDNLLYSNNDGPSTWTGNWSESDGTQSPTAGNVQVINGELRMQTTNSWAARSVDFGNFVPGGFAFLRFNYRTNPAFIAGNSIAVQISVNGGAYANVGTLTGITGATSGTLLYDISGSLPAGAPALLSVRFYSTSLTAGSFYVDKVEMRAVGSRVTVAQDNLDTNTFTGGSGWLGNWIEVDTTGAGPAAGKVRVTGGRLRLNGAVDSATGPSAARQVNLSSGNAFAFLYFDFATDAGVTATDAAVVEVSSDGTNFTTLETFTGLTGASNGSRVYDITNYMSATTTIRYRTSANYSVANHYFYVDNVIVRAGRQLPVTKSNAVACSPNCLADGIASNVNSPDIVLPSDDFALAPGETLTANFTVTADNPLYETRIVNIVNSASYEKAPPSNSTVINTVSPGGTIGDLVWLDTIVDGVFTTGEPGLDNVRVWLDTNGNGTFEPGTDLQTLTGTDGKYLFEGLQPGTYAVNVDTTTLPAGLALSSAGPNPSAPITITDQESVLNIDFGYKNNSSGTAIIGDYVWSDANNNGLEDPGEVGIGNVTMRLFIDTNGNGTYDAGIDTLRATTTTNAFGRYLFIGVSPGTYRVEAVNVPAGYAATVGPESIGSTVSNPIAVTGGSTWMMMDFGFRNPSLFTISDRVYFDSNNNGAFDTGEPGIKDVTVTLLNSLGQVMGATTTDVNGNFSFTGVPNGSYTIKIEDASGKLIGYAGTTAAAKTKSKAVTVSGGNVSGTSFGYNAPGRIGDLVWRDTNRNGLQDAGEPGISGVTVGLYSDTNGNGIFEPGTDLFIASTTTDSDGNYMFQVNTAGRYFVSIDESQAAIAGLSLTTTDAEPQLSAPGAQVQVDFLNLNQSQLGADFGYMTPLASALSVTKTSSASGSVNPGDEITYSITVTNTSATTQTNIRVTDWLPANTTYVAQSTAVTGIVFVPVSGPFTVNLVADRDTWLNQASNGNNYGLDTLLDISGRTNNARRPIAHFNVSGIPSNATVSSSTLQFFVTTTNANITANVYRLTKDWIEGTGGAAGAACAGAGNGATWLTYNCGTTWWINAGTGGGAYDNTILIGSFAVNTGGAKTVTTANLTTMVQNWVNLTSLNAGVIITTTNTGNNTAVIGSHDNATAANRPQLSVTYTLPAYYSLVTKDNIPGGTYSDLSDGVPYNLVLPADGFLLRTGETMTVTYKVKVNNPLSSGVTEIRNMVEASSVETPTPVRAVVSNNVVSAPGVMLTKSAPGLVPYPLTTLAAGAAAATVITVTSVQYINVGDVIIVGGTAAMVTAVNAVTKQVTLDTAVTDGSGNNVVPTIPFLLNYQNTTGATMTGVTVTDVLQAGLLYYRASPTPFSAPAIGSNGTVTWNIGTLAPGAFGTLKIWARPAAPGAGGSGSYNNSGTINYNSVSSFTSNITNTKVGAMTLSKTTSSPVRVSGTTATYTITLYNQLPSTAATAIQITDTLPSGFTYASTSSFLGCSGGTTTNPTVGAAVPVWTCNSLAGAGTITITFVTNIASTTPSGTYQNPVAATSANVSVIPFDHLATTAEDVTVTVPNDLSVTKTIQSQFSPCVVGDCEVAYLITVRNLGTLVASGVVVTDVWPAALTYVSSSTSNGSYSDATKQWTLGSNLNPSASATLQLTGKVNAKGTIQNCATVPVDSILTNNSSCINITPTVTSLSDFRSYMANGQVIVRWETSSETDTAGFYLFRLDESTGQYQPMNRRLLPSVLTSQQGGIYSLVDRAARPSTNTYLLVEMEGSGSKNVYGPFRVTVGGENASTDPQSMDLGRAGFLNTLSSNNSGPDSRNSAGKVSVYTDKDGIKVVNIGGPSASHYTSSDGDLFEDFVRKPHEISPAAKARLQASREQKESFIQSGAMKSGDMRSLLASGSVTAGKLSVSSNGLYYLDASEIAGLLGMTSGEVIELIRNTGLLLANQGKYVAYLPSEDNTGIFFYGQGIDSIYTNDNIYKVKRGSGIKMAYVPSLETAVSEETTFPETAHAEVNTILASGLANDPNEDYWFWDYIIAGDPINGKKTFTLSTPGVAPISSNVALTVRLLGYTSTPATVDHHAVISVNGTEIGGTTWDGQSPAIFDLVFDQALLNDGDNAITVTGLLDTGAPYSTFFVDSFDLSYLRYFRAEDDMLAFAAPFKRKVTVTGFTGPDIYLFNVTNPFKPALITGADIEATDSDFSVTFTAPKYGNRYLAVTASTVYAVDDAAAYHPPSLKAYRNQADYVVIAPEELVATAQRLADYRSGQGHSSMVVPLEDIMNQFNYGLTSPAAIRNFLAYAQKGWKKPPKYVVLIGEGTYDYKNFRGLGGNLVPPLMVSASSGLSPSDSLFGDVDGDGVPDIAVGRLPVLTAAELDTVIDKIIAFEAGLRGTVLMLADKPDSGGDFSSDSDDIALLVPAEHPLEKIYLANYASSTLARQALLSRLNSTSVLLNYIGHGGVDKLSTAQLLSLTYLSSLTNPNSLPVIAAMTCDTGQYAIPGYDSLSEALLIKSSGGAAAVWAPSGLSYNSLAKVLDEGFVGAAFAGEDALLGDAILTAYRHYASKGGPAYMMGIYNLIGDPALRLW